MIWNIWPIFSMFRCFFSLVWLSKLIIFIFIDVTLFYYNFSKNKSFTFNIYNFFNKRGYTFKFFVFNIFNKKRERLLFSFSIMVKTILFINFLVYIYVHMVMYLFHQEEYNAYHQKLIKIFYYFHRYLIHVFRFYSSHFMSNSFFIKVSIFKFFIFN